MARKLIDASWWYTYPLNLFVYAKKSFPSKTPQSNSVARGHFESVFYDLAKKKRPQQQVEVLVFLESNAIKRAIHGLSFRSIRIKRLIFPQIALGIRNGWYLSMLFGVYAGIFSVASLHEVRQIQVCLLFVSSVSEMVGEKKCCEFWLATYRTWKCYGGFVTFPALKKNPKKATENNNNLRLPASWGRCPSSESLMMYCQAPEEGFKPFRFNLEGVLLVPQLMVNWWFGIRIAVPLRIPIPFIFRGSHRNPKHQTP